MRFDHSFHWTGLHEIIIFTEMSLEKFVLVCHISCFWEHAFLFKNRHNTQWFFDQINACLQIHAKIDKSPFNTLTLVFFLFKNKHVMVEKLLETFICIIDTKLLEGILLKNFKTGDIQNTDEKVAWKFC